MKNEVSALVEEALSGIIPVLELRGTDEFASAVGDLDFIVAQGQAESACRIVAQAAQKKGWFLAGFRDIGYLAQIVIVRPVAAGLDNAIKIDFFDGLRWYGVGKDVAGQRLFEFILPNEQRKIRLAGAVGFFQKILIVGRGSERDWARVAATGADTVYLVDIAKALDLPITYPQVEARGISCLAKWRLRAASGGAEGILSSFVWFVRVSAAHLKFKLSIGSKAGLVLGISGLDGSGKSTLANRLVAAYSKAGGNQPELIHLLPSWIPMPHQVFRRRKTQINYTRPYSEPPVSSKLNGGLRLAFYLCAFTFARLSLWVGMKRGRLIVHDRSFLDFVSDLTRSRIPARQLPGWLLRWLMPSGRLFYLDASPEVVVARKGELTLKRGRALRARYLENCATVRATLLRGDEPPDVVFTELLGHLSQEYMQRIAFTKIRNSTSR